MMPSQSETIPRRSKTPRDRLETETFESEATPRFILTCNDIKKVYFIIIDFIYSAENLM